MNTVLLDWPESYEDNILTLVPKLFTTAKRPEKRPFPGRQTLAVRRRRAQNLGRNFPPGGGLGRNQRPPKKHKWLADNWIQVSWGGASLVSVEYGRRRGGSQWLAGRIHVRIRFWKTTARRFGNRYRRLAGMHRCDTSLGCWCQQKNGCALTALDGNYGIKPRALPWAVMWRPCRPCTRTAILEKGCHGFIIDGTAQP